jgi:L-ascorbate metabolism protein UlaG (beta-lactamase superfamily)
MKVHHLRNATLVIETGDKVILVDPMLGKKEQQVLLSHFFDLNHNGIPL